MKRRRKVIVEIATSADGYIARLDGDVSWLDRPQPKGHYGMGAFVKSIDTILWGRKTYAKGIEMGMKDGGFGPKIKNYPAFLTRCSSIVDSAASWFIFLCFGFRYWFFDRAASLELSCWNA
jgi:hypothetical protein